MKHSFCALLALVGILFASHSYALDSGDQVTLTAPLHFDGNEVFTADVEGLSYCIAMQSNWSEDPATIQPMTLVVDSVETEVSMKSGHGRIYITFSSASPIALFTCQSTNTNIPSMDQVRAGAASINLVIP